MHLVTYEQVASLLPRRVRCAIEGGHRWDTEDERLLRKIGQQATRFPCRECEVCHLMEPNPVFVRPSCP